MSEGVPTTVYILVGLSALFHATWNFAARKVKGNLAVFFYSNLFGSLCLVPFTFLLESPTIDDVLHAAPIYAASGTFHAGYMLSLARAYTTGELSRVYPLARGTGVVGTAIAASTLLKEHISILGGWGICAIAVGILLISIPQPKRFGRNLWWRGDRADDLSDSVELLRRAGEQTPVVDEVQDEEAAPTEPRAEDKERSRHKVVAAAGATEVDLPQVGEDQNRGDDDISEVDEANEGRERLWKALLPALTGVPVGLCIAGSVVFAQSVTLLRYSTVDKFGVGSTPPILFLLGRSFVGSLWVWPYLLRYRREQTVLAFRYPHSRPRPDRYRELKLYILVIGVGSVGTNPTPGVIGTRPGLTRLSYVVAMRELAVVIGAGFGVVLLKEPLTLFKMVGVLCVGVGLVLIKMV